MWEILLQNYPDRAYVDNIIGMINHGAKLGYNGPLRETGRPSASTSNLPMTTDEVTFVREVVALRVSRSATARYEPARHGSFTCSPVGTVPKAGGQMRMINHLSHPRTKGTPSVNDGIDCADIPLSYENLDAVMNVLRTAWGQPLHVWKVDLKDAFWHIAVALRDAGLLGFHLDGVDYVDCTLNFGGRSSPFIFNYVAEGIHWILESYGLQVSHFLDDFFGITTASTSRATLAFVTAVIEALGGQVSPKKCAAGPSLEILGITFDTESGRAWISDTKLARVRQEVHETLTTRPPDPKKIRSTAGLLSFVSRVCPYGRGFIRGLYDWLRLFEAGKTSRLHGLPQPATHDLLWWKSTLRDWNGISVIRRRGLSTEIWTDAATTAGIGGHLGPREDPAAAFSLPVIQEGLDIMTLEALALLAAIKQWGERLRGYHITCKLDNQVVVAAVHTGRCRHQPTQEVIRNIFGKALRLDLELTPEWVPSEENYVADALSRFDTTSLSTRCPSVLPMVNINQPAIPASARAARPNVETASGDLSTGDTPMPDLAIDMFSVSDPSNTGLAYSEG